MDPNKTPSYCMHVVLVSSSVGSNLQNITTRPSLIHCSKDSLYLTLHVSLKYPISFGNWLNVKQAVI